ncbi:MAG: LPS assembly lipoprotein LptE [Endomicrobiia bacterium]|nr:LPS assembly lipoprotein LptE [Endomicrobiia bacterium]
MNKLKANLFLFSILGSLFWAFYGCGVYEPLPQRLPHYIRNVAIVPFRNETPFYGLEAKLTLKLTDELLRDGRFTLSKMETAQGYLEGNIKKYILSPLSYDANLIPTSYKLWIIADVWFVDKINNVTLWQEPNFEGAQIFMASTQPGGITEEAARELIWETMSRNIIRRTVEGFGAAKGASEKKVPR